MADVDARWLRMIDRLKQVTSLKERHPKDVCDLSLWLQVYKNDRVSFRRLLAAVEELAPTDRQDDVIYGYFKVMERELYDWEQGVQGEHQLSEMPLAAFRRLILRAKDIGERKVREKPRCSAAA